MHIRKDDGLDTASASCRQSAACSREIGVVGAYGRDPPLRSLMHHHHPGGDDAVIDRAEARHHHEAEQCVEIRHAARVLGCVIRGVRE